MDEFKKFLLGIGLTLAVAFIGVCLVVAWLYSIFVAFGLAGVALLAATRWLILPILKGSMEIGMQWQTHRLDVRKGYALITPDANGNYPAIVQGGQIQYIMPGNAPFKQITAGKGQHTIETTVTEVEDNTPKQIAPPANVETLFLSSDYALPADDFLSGRKLVVGVSGSGKSNSVGAYCEELGSLGVPFILADTEDEYRPLCNPQWLKRGLLAGMETNYPITVDNADQFGAYVLDNHLQVILNLQSYEFEEAALVMVGIIGGMRQWQEARDNEHRIPSDFILEESVTWLPQYVRESPLHGTETLAQLQGTFFNDMVRKGRKRGLGLTLVCQKIAELDNRAMQCDGKLLHRQTEESDLERYRKMGINRDETLSLANGEAFLYTGRVSKLRIQIRRRHSPHGANTPGLENLKRDRSFVRNDEIPSKFQSDFATDTEPLRNISTFPARAQKSGLEDVPEDTKAAILDLYRAGTKRTDIQARLGLNGDEYWMIKTVCNEYDRAKEA